MQYSHVVLSIASSDQISDHYFVDVDWLWEVRANRTLPPAARPFVMHLIFSCLSQPASLCVKQTTVQITELKLCNLLVKPWCWMEWAYVRWADGRSDQAGGALDGQTGGRAPRLGPHCLVTVPHCMQSHLFLTLLPPLFTHIYKQTHRQTNTANWEKATAAICCRLKDYPAEAYSGWKNLLFFSFLFFSSGELCSRVKVYNQNGNTCAQNACIYNTDSDSVAALVPVTSTMLSKEKSSHAEALLTIILGLVVMQKYIFYGKRAQCCLVCSSAFLWILRRRHSALAKLSYYLWMAWY